MKRVLTLTGLRFIIFITTLILWQGLAWAAQGFVVRGSSSIEYDSNVRYSPQDEIEDFITRLTLGLQYYIEDEIQSFDILAQVHRQFYLENSNFDNFAQDLSLFYRKEVSKFHNFYIEDTFAHDEDAITFEDEFGRESGRFDTYNNIFRYTINHELSQENTLIASYGNEIKEIDRSDLLDSVYNNINLEFDHAWTSKTKTFLTYDFSHRYIDTPDNAFIQTLAPGFKQQFTNQLLLTAYAGPTFIHTYDDQNLVRPAYYVTLADELDETNNLILGYKQSHITTGYIDDIFDQWRIWLEYQRKLLERLRAYMKTFYGEGEFVRRDINDKFTAIGVGLTYNLNVNLTTTLAVDYSQKDSSVFDREYKKTTVFLEFTLGF